MSNLKMPVIDIEKIQERANEAAEKAYLKEVEEYYTSYNSPYRKMVKEQLEKQDFKYNMKLPNILEKMNEGLSQEVDRMANNAIAMTYIPMISKVAIGLAKEMKWSEILKLIIEELEADADDYDSFIFSYEENVRHSWLNCELHTNENYYSFTLHTGSSKGSYQLLSFPYDKANNTSNTTMKVYKDDVKIEMPFVSNILQDKVLEVFFKMMISNTHVEMDCNSFEEDMFPQQENCHC